MLQLDADLGKKTVRAMCVVLLEPHLFFHQEMLSRISGIYLGFRTCSSLNRAEGKRYMHSMFINSGHTAVIPHSVCNQTQVW